MRYLSSSLATRPALRRDLHRQFLLPHENPFGAAEHLAQVAAHRRNGPLFVAIGQSAQDLAMLLDQERNVAGILLQGQVAHAVEMNLGLPDYLPDALEAAGSGDGVMEVFIQGIEAGRRRGLLLPLDDLAELAQRGRVDESNRLGDERAFEMLADELGVPKGFPRDGRDHGAALRINPDEIGVGELDQRLAHRRATDAEAAAKVKLGHRRARRQRAADDLVEQALIDLVGEPRTELLGRAATRLHQLRGLILHVARTKCSWSSIHALSPRNRRHLTNTATPQITENRSISRE